MRKEFVLYLGILAMACGKDSPKPPEAALLSFPLQNSECTTGVSLNNNTSQVEFRWQEARYADTYELKVTNVLTGLSITNAPTTALSSFVPVLKGTPYKWRITTRNTETQEIGFSEEWFFYNAGTQTTYPPFPAQLIEPASGTPVVRDLNNEITLKWTSGDADNDIQSYEVYLDTDPDPQQLVASPSVSITQVKASVAIDTVYYWKVLTLDRAGNISDSGVYSFRVIR
ncbi:hypothetical protein SAMN06265375_101844 [Muriicola jejuensis]|uniref:Fibronectin type-III domain-containing protein n=1 Tax=Muriicola jejuensis TaxID=504488 RepID=A0A6P0UAV6_9FLAO|nr:hypothetical protein [Muriicola jejuensis]NER09640.1 hypothetical protein [Muriicola jejuensis]SMP07182.1 hypothetical protein SAMN06265375_101844 [Muriicola jejuensis]